MVFESNFSVDSVQYGDVYNYPKEPKFNDPHACPGWSPSTSGGSPPLQLESSAPKAGKVAQKKSKKKNPEGESSWGPVFKDRNTFNDMHCF